MNINQIFKRSFRFSANRYEEWQAGQCLSKGQINCIVTAEAGQNSIHFELSDKQNLRILDSFDFEIQGSNILPDRIQYVNSTMDYNPIVPIVCHLFVEDGTISYVRFAMTNPDRLIEFYGEVIEFDQPGLRKRKSSPRSDITAEQIMSELRSYGMLNTDALMERAVKLYNDNSNVQTKEQALRVIEALKLFVKCNELDSEEYEDRVSMLKPKILMFIALCNYKIGNINQAYYVAQKASSAIDEAEENSMFDGIPRSMYGEDTINELIRVIEKNHWDKVDEEMSEYDVDENEIETSFFDKLMGGNNDNGATSKQNIKGLIELITRIQEQFSKIGEQTGDGMKAFQNNKMFEMFKNVLYFAWEKYGYGWHDDFWKEGDSMFDYMIFEINAKEMISNLIRLLNDASPFRYFEPNGAVTNSLKNIYQDLLDKLESGDIKMWSIGQNVG